MKSVKRRLLLLAPGLSEEQRGNSDLAASAPDQRQSTQTENRKRRWFSPRRTARHVPLPAGHPMVPLLPLTCSRDDDFAIAQTGPAPQPPAATGWWAQAPSTYVVGLPGRGSR